MNILDVNESNRPRANGYLQKLAGVVSQIPLSIRDKFLMAFFLVILFSGIINAVLVIRVLDYKRGFDAMMNNIAVANGLNGSFKTSIDTSLWDIVKGEVQFDQGDQYQIIHAASQEIQWLSDHTDAEGGKQRLEVLRLRQLGEIRKGKMGGGMTMGRDH